MPPAPASVSVPASSADGTATVSWASVAQVTHYIAQQSSDGGTNWTQVYNGAALSTALSGLANGSYVYRVEACNAYNCSAWTRSGTLLVTHPPTGVPTLSVPGNSTNGSFSISWTAVSTATSYTLQESTNGGSTWTSVQSNGSTNWSTSGRGNGSYSYRVQACNVGGCAGWSGVGTTTVLLPPPTPTGVTVPSTSNGPIPISWNASPTATRYDVYQSINNGGWTTVYSGASTSVTVTATSTGSYQFFVTANNTSGWSGQVASSAAVNVTIPPNSAPSISAPGNSTNGSYTVSWTGVAGATYYNLQEQVNGGGWSTVQSNGAGNWSASGKGNGTYGYHVQACNAGGCGPWSGAVNVSVTLIPPPPTNVQAIDGFPNSKTETLTIQWAASPGATSYDIFDATTGVVKISGLTGTSSIVESGSTGSIPMDTYEVRACNAVGCSAWVYAN